jgi:hypothetical protein
VHPHARLCTATDGFPRLALNPDVESAPPVLRDRFEQTEENAHESIP